MQAVRADLHAMPDDDADAGDAEQKPQHLAPGQRLAEEQRGERRREDGIGRDDQAAEAGGDRFQPGIAEAEIERVVGDAQDREDGHLAPGELPGAAAKGGGAEDHDSRKRETRGKQDQRRTIGDADLAGDKGEAPEQAEQADVSGRALKRLRGAGTASEGASDMAGLLRPLI